MQLIPSIPAVLDSTTLRRTACFCLYPTHTPSKHGQTSRSTINHPSKCLSDMQAPLFSFLCPSELTDCAFFLSRDPLLVRYLLLSCPLGRRLYLLAPTFVPRWGSAPLLVSVRPVVLSYHSPPFLLIWFRQVRTVSKHRLHLRTARV